MKNFVIVALVFVVGWLGWMVLSDDEPASNQSSSDTNETENNVDETASSGETLDLSDRGLESLSTNMFNDKSVTTLDVSGNNLTGALPGEIRQMSNLEVLDASDNKLTGVPAEIGQLSKLRVADFSNNNISGLPLEIGNLDNLETMDLRGNPNVSTHDLGLIRAEIPDAQILTD